MRMSAVKLCQCQRLWGSSRDTVSAEVKNTDQLKQTPQLSAAAWDPSIRPSLLIVTQGHEVSCVKNPEGQNLDCNDPAFGFAP